MKVQYDCCAFVLYVSFVTMIQAHDADKTHCVMSFINRQNCSAETFIYCQIGFIRVCYGSPSYCYGVLLLLHTCITKTLFTFTFY